jgi:PadR family transcriptional regulator, regulatory protein PadR
MRKLLGSLELVVLLAVIHLGDDAYGVPVTREVVRASRRRWPVASVYAALDRLQAKGLVASEKGEPTPERGGRAKRYFRVTAKGLRVVRDTQRTLAVFWQFAPQER